MRIRTRRKVKEQRGEDGLSRASTRTRTRNKKEIDKKKTKEKIICKRV